jgi:hypothetical protein
MVHFLAGKGGRDHWLLASTVFFLRFPIDAERCRGRTEVEVGLGEGDFDAVFPEGLVDGVVQFADHVVLVDGVGNPAQQGEIQGRVAELAEPGFGFGKIEDAGVFRSHPDQDSRRLFAV